MLLATAAASAVLALAAPGAYAGESDWKHEDSSYSKEHGKDGKHDAPRGGMHTGGGALTAVNEEEWGSHGDYEKKESYGGHEKESYGGGHEKESYGGGHEKPRGGMHTGGGALASPGVTAGGLAVLAVAGTGLYMARRTRSAANAA
jgi:hypothetical protein